MEYADLLNDIKQSGILQCLYINYGNFILDGHHRFKAEKELGIKEVEVRIPDLNNISEDEYLIFVALNRRRLPEVHKIALMAEYADAITKDTTMRGLRRPMILSIIMGHEKRFQGSLLENLIRNSN